MNINDYKEGKLPKETLEEITVELMKASIDKYYTERWTNILKQEHGVERIKKTNRIATQNWYRVAALAASVLLCVGLFFYLNRADDAPLSGSTEQLLAAHLSERYPSETGRGDKDAHTARKAARTAYTQERYAEATQHYQEITETERTAEDQFFLGLSYLYQKNGSTQAVAALQAAQRMEEAAKGEYSQVIDWHLALAQLKNGEIAAAKRSLQQLIDGDTYVKDKAIELLKTLE